MKSKFLFIVSFSAFLFAFKNASDKFLNAPKYFGVPSYDFSQNPLSKEKILLGRALFHDPILSENNTISCTSCHSQYNAFTHTDHNLSHGIFDSIGTRNSPALMNLAWQNSFMWDGAIHNLDVQSLAPISNKTEMGSSIESVLKRLSESNIYPNLFKDAYGTKEITGEKTLKALSSFMLTMVSANAKYDKVKRKEEKFTPQEENGYLLFQKNCNACHTEPFFTNQTFENNGLPLDSILQDFGKMTISKNPSDARKFKVPTLRNIEFSYPYMHDGRFSKLKQVLNHYTSGVENSETVSENLKTKIQLSETEKVDLISFLLCLSDKDFLFNKDFSYPKDVLFK